jgi:hypothetical protein
MADHEIRIGGAKYQLPTVALTLMVAAMLVPTVRYSISLHDPTPAQLLVAICIAVFSSVVALWVLDAVSVLQFRSAWVSRGVYGVAIASILGTSVGVYQGAFADRKYPSEGAWDVRVVAVAENSTLAHHQVVLIHSETADVYWGYANATLSGQDAQAKAAWLEVVEFIPEKGSISLRLLMRDGKEIAVESQLKSENKGKSYHSGDDVKYKVVLSRPR